MEIIAGMADNGRVIQRDKDKCRNGINGRNEDNERDGDNWRDQDSGRDVDNDTSWWIMEAMEIIGGMEIM